MNINLKIYDAHQSLQNPKFPSAPLSPGISGKCFLSQPVSCPLAPPTMPLSAFSGLILEKICLRASGPNCPVIVLMICSLLSVSCLANCFSAVSLTTFFKGSGSCSQSQILGLSFSKLVTMSSCVLFIFVTMLFLSSSILPRVCFLTPLICSLMPLMPESQSMDFPCCFSTICKAPPILTLLLTSSQILVTSLSFPSTSVLVLLVNPPKVSVAWVLTLPNQSRITSLPFSVTISFTKVYPYSLQSFQKMLPAQHYAPIKIC